MSNPEPREIMFHRTLADVTSVEIAEEFLSLIRWQDIDDACLANEYIAAIVQPMREHVDAFGLTEDQADMGVIDLRALIRGQVECDRGPSSQWEDARKMLRQALAEETPGRHITNREIEVIALAAGLLAYGVPYGGVIRVLLGEEASIRDVAQHVQASASRGGRSSSDALDLHAHIFQWLNNSTVPGSAAARAFVSRWVGGASGVPRAEMNASIDEVEEILVIAQEVLIPTETPATVETVESLVRITERGLDGSGGVVPRLGQPVDIDPQMANNGGPEALAAIRATTLSFATPPRPLQPPAATAAGPRVDLPQEARTRFESAVCEVMRCYNGDLMYVVNAFATDMVAYGIRHVQQVSNIRERLAAALEATAAELRS